MFRPHRARWFEIVVARDDAFVALEALAVSRCVEVQAPAASETGPLGASEAALAKYAALAERYQSYWPAAAARPLGIRTMERRAPAEAIGETMERLQAWAVQAEPLIERFQVAQMQLADLALMGQTLRALRSTRLDLAQLAQARNGVTACVVALPRTSETALSPEVLFYKAQAEQGDRLLLVLGPPAAISLISQAAIDAGGHHTRLPAWISASIEEDLAQLDERYTALDKRLRSLQAEIDALARAYDLAYLLGDVLRAAWCFEHGGDVAMGDASHGEVFARIRGWTVEPQQLAGAIERAGARAIVAFPPPPANLAPPMVLRNPWWARPFEFFTKLMGMPAATGADPSMLLAFAVPLLFGYMFGDVGQGLVLVIIGLSLGRRLRALRLLIPAGLAASIFGVLFGVVFCNEASIAPIWLAPLAQPLLVLVVPIAGGAFLLLLGMLVNLAEAIWQDEVHRWAQRELPILAIFLGLLLMIAMPGAWVLAGIGLAGSLIAGIRERSVHRGCLFNGLASLARAIGATLELLVNTLSFARVGAFALAHAGLASAVMALANAADSPFGRVAVIALGNVVILAIEGLVVSIQTTRLVLFEFFLRFFEKHGRAFRPLLPPPISIEET